MKIENNVQSDNIRAVEEREGKKVFKKNLRLNKETIRKLKDSDLRRVAGGASGTCSDLCTYGIGIPCI